MKQFFVELAALLAGLCLAAPVTLFTAIIAFDFNGTIWSLLITMLGAGIGAAIVIALLHSVGRYDHKSRC